MKLYYGSLNGNDSDNSSNVPLGHDDCTVEELSRTNEEYGKDILSLAIPALAGLAIDPLMTLVDTAFVGRCANEDSAQLAGMGSAAALLTFSFYIFNFLCTATTPLVSQARAKLDESKAVMVGGQALSLAGLLGVTLTGVLVAFHEPLLQIMGTSYTGEEANSYATSFLLVRAFSAPAIFVCSAATGILRGYLDTKTAIAVLAVANTVNLSLDVLLIAGLGMGPAGAAIATTTAEWMSAILYLLILGGKLPSIDGYLGSNQKPEISSNDRDIIRIFPTVNIPQWAEMKPLVVASSSVFLRTVVLQLFLSGAASMAARGYSDESSASSVAAHQIAIQLWLLCSFACDALAAASQTLVADSLGKDDEVATRKISGTVFTYSLSLGILLSIALVGGTMSGALLDAFTNDPSIQAALQPILYLIILAQPINSLVFAADGVLQGASEFTYQAKTMWISVGIATLSFFTFQYNNISQMQILFGSNTLEHVWESMIVLQLCRGITSYIKIRDKRGPIKL